MGEGFCPKCGEKSLEGAAFCAHCGFNLQARMDEDAHVSTQQTFNAQEDVGNNLDEHKHSGIGIASFIISVIIGAMLFIVITVGAVAEILSAGGLGQGIYAIVGLLMCSGMAGDIIALVLGIVGLTQKKKKIFAILGTTISALTLFVVIFLIIIGNSAEFTY